MLRTFFVAAVVGAGVSSAAAVPEAAGLDARDAPPSYFCSSNVKKCSKQKPEVTAYCSSYLAIPKVTKTKTVTKTQTAKVTSITATVTKGSKTVTSTITSCAAPGITPPPVAEDDGNESENESLPEARKRDAPATYKPHKPSCLSSQKDKKSISAACKCYNIKPSTKTVTKTRTKTVTKTIKTTTVEGTTSTSFVFPEPTTFLIGNNRGGVVYEECIINDDRERVGLGDLLFKDDQSDALLFSYEGSQLVALEGTQGTVFRQLPREGEDPNYRVRIGSDLIGDEDTAALTCSISQGADGTCPLACTIVRGDGDTNQGTGNGDWFLAPPGAITDLTYDTFAITRTDPDQVGGGGCGMR